MEVCGGSCWVVGVCDASKGALSAGVAAPNNVPLGLYE